MSARAIALNSHHARLGRIGALACAMLLIAGGAKAQSLGANGSIGVSLTVLQPVSTQPVRVVGFSVDRTGMATLQTTAPVSGPATQLVMSTVSSSAGDVQLVSQASALVRGDRSASRDTTSDGESRSSVAHPGDDVSQRLSYVVNVGRPTHGALGSRPVQLRIEYLAVAGT